MYRLTISSTVCADAGTPPTAADKAMATPTTIIRIKASALGSPMYHGPWPIRLCTAIAERAVRWDETRVAGDCLPVRRARYHPGMRERTFELNGHPTRVD